MGLRSSRRVLEAEHGSHPSWLITFCDLIFLLLAFFVLKFSMSSLKQTVEVTDTTPKIELKKIVGGEETGIVGAFSPGDSAELSFRGKTALNSFAAQASELKQDVVVKVEILSFPREFWPNPESVKELLSAQRRTVMRQLVDSGLSLEAILVEPISAPKADVFGASNEDKSLSSRISLVLQQKRT
jgi:hypothetical protein